MKRLANQLVGPELGLVLGVGGDAGDDERHFDGFSGGSVLCRQGDAVLLMMFVSVDA